MAQHKPIPATVTAELRTDRAEPNHGLSPFRGSVPLPPVLPPDMTGGEKRKWSESAPTTQKTIHRTFVWTRPWPPDRSAFFRTDLITFFNRSCFRPADESNTSANNGLCRRTAVVVLRINTRGRSDSGLQGFYSLHRKSRLLVWNEPDRCLTQVCFESLRGVLDDHGTAVGVNKR